jgi:hypothetical protein
VEPEVEAVRVDMLGLQAALAKIARTCTRLEDELCRRGLSHSDMDATVRVVGVPTAVMRAKAYETVTAFLRRALVNVPDALRDSVRVGVRRTQGARDAYAPFHGIAELDERARLTTLEHAGFTRDDTEMVLFAPVQVRVMAACTDPLPQWVAPHVGEHRFLVAEDVRAVECQVHALLLDACPTGADLQLAWHRLDTQTQRMHALPPGSLLASPLLNKHAVLLGLVTRYTPAPVDFSFDVRLEPDDDAGAYAVRVRGKCVRVQAGWHVERVKQAVQEATGLDAARMTLRLPRFHHLDTARTMADNHVRPDDTLLVCMGPHLFDPVTGLMSLYCLVGDRQVSVLVSRDCTIAQLADKVCAETGLVPERQRLRLNGTVLQGALSAYALTRWSMVTVETVRSPADVAHERAHATPMLLAVKLPTSHTVELTLPSNSSVAHATALVADLLQAPVERLQLRTDGVALTHGTLLDYDVQKHVTLALLGRGAFPHVPARRAAAAALAAYAECMSHLPPGSMDVNVRTLTGEALVLRVESDTSIKQVKLQIRAIHGAPVEKQRVIFAGKELDDERTLADYCIPRESDLHLVLRQRVSPPLVTAGRAGPYQLHFAEHALHVFDAVCAFEAPAAFDGLSTHQLETRLTFARRLLHVFYSTAHATFLERDRMPVQVDAAACRELCLEAGAPAPAAVAVPRM